MHGKNKSVVGGKTVRPLGVCKSTNKNDTPTHSPQKTLRVL